MAETRQLAVVLAAIALVGLIGLALVMYIMPMLDQGDAVVDQYHATWYANGTLVEDFVYDIKVSGVHSWLYRSWDDVLSLTSINQPHISLVSISAPPGMIAYAKDYSGSIWVSPPYDQVRSVTSAVMSDAGLNEVGCYDPSTLDAGTYNVRYVFYLHPPVQYDANLVHFNLKLASTHIAYSVVTITIENANYVETLYPHPPLLQMTRAGNTITLQGSAVTNELLEIEMLLSKDVLNVMDAFKTQMSDVSTPTAQANWAYSAEYYGAVVLRDFAEVLVVVYPLAFLVVYYLYGRETPYVVPEYLSYVPNKDRRPWLVNLVFKDDAMDFDQDGLYATLLDLHMKNKIKITQEGTDLAIQIIDPEYGDPYERRALGFLQGLAENGVVRTNSINRHIKTLSATKQYTSLISLQSDFLYLTTKADPEIADQFVEKGTSKLIPFAAVPVIIFFVSLVLASAVDVVSYLAWDAALTSGVLFVQALIAIFSPSTLFGRWKGDTYQEKLEWDSFKKFLSDLALMRKYAPADLSMWGEWLVYGTALGVGNTVSQAMKVLNVPLTEVDMVPMMPIMFRPIIIWSMPAPAGARGGFGGGHVGGGFGGGGGLGGGGGGVR